jgi:hypothetical protein
MASDLLKSLKKDELLHLKDGFRPFLQIRYWVFQDLFVSGAIFLHHKNQGFIQVREEDIDWQEYKGRKIHDPNFPDKSK